MIWFVSTLINMTCKNITKQKDNFKNDHQYGIHNLPTWNEILKDSPSNKCNRERERRAHSSQCCGLTLFHGLVLYIGINSFHLSPLDRIVHENYWLTMTMRERYTPPPMSIFRKFSNTRNVRSKRDDLKSLKSSINKFIRFSLCVKALTKKYMYTSPEKVQNI